LVSLGASLAVATPAAAGDGVDTPGAEASAPAEPPPSPDSQPDAASSPAAPETQSGSESEGQPAVDTGAPSPQNTSAPAKRPPEADASAQHQENPEPQIAATDGGTAVDAQATTQGEDQAAGDARPVTDGGAEGEDEGATAAKPVTHGGVTVSGNGRHAHVRIRPSEELRGALREKARSEAKEQVRVRHAWDESAGGDRTSISTKVATPRVRVHERSPDAEAGAFLRVVQAAWQRGGPKTTNALLEFCFGSKSSSQPLPHEVSAVLDKLEGGVPPKQHGHDKGETPEKGETETPETGETPHTGETPDKGETPHQEEIPGTDVEDKLTTPVAETPSTPVVPATPSTPVTPETITPASLETSVPSTPAVPVATSPSSGEDSVLGDTDSGETAPGGANTGGESSNGVVTRRSATAAPGGLPFTGLDVPLILCGGIGALLAGAALRRRVLR
jgi:hypothetical protein